MVITFTQCVMRIGSSQTYLRPYTASRWTSRSRGLVAVAIKTSSADHYFRQRAAIRTDDVRSAGEARIERVDSPQDLDGLPRIGHRRTDERRFVSAMLPLGVLRRGVPGGRHHDLVVLNLAVVDLD